MKRMMVGDADHPRTQHDPARALRRCRDEDVGRRNYFPSGRVMLADVGFVVTELVQPFDQFQIAFIGQRGVLSGRMKGRKKDAELHNADASNWRPACGALARLCGWAGSDA